MAGRSVKRKDFLREVRIARISYLAKQGLSDADIKKEYSEASAGFIKMIADRARREMEELS